MSDEEIFNGDDCDGDGLYEEGEEGEEEMDYADYGEEVQPEEEAISNAGEEGEEESTKLNT